MIVQRSQTALHDRRPAIRDQKRQNRPSSRCTRATPWRRSTRTGTAQHGRPRRDRTIGHWTCPVPTFLEPLDHARINLLADVRAQPGSRRSPQFGGAEMARCAPTPHRCTSTFPSSGDAAVGKASIPASTPAGKTRASSKYADYTLTSEYRRGLTRLISLAGSNRLAIMCGEPMPWRCHRQLSREQPCRPWMDGMAPDERFRPAPAPTRPMGRHTRHRRAQARNVPRQMPALP